LDDRNACIFKRGDSPKLRIAFKPSKSTHPPTNPPCLDRDISALKATVKARVSDVETEFLLDNDNSCQGQNLTCPLKSGETYYYTQTIHIANDYPSVRYLNGGVLTDFCRKTPQSIGSLMTRSASRKSPRAIIQMESVCEMICVLFSLRRSSSVE
jgi:hypothetical protein